MFSPDGQTGDIPQAKATDAVQAGFKPAYEMTAPDGKTLGYIPADKAKAAVDAGFKPTTNSHIQGFNSAGQPVLGSDAPPSALELYKQALFNPVGSGAHSQGVLGGIEQVGGRALQDIAAPAMHPLDTLKGAAEMGIQTSALGPIANKLGMPNPIQQRAEQFQADKAQGGLPLALENVAGDVVGGVEGGRMTAGAVEGVKPSPALGPVNSLVPSALQRGVLPSAVSAVSSTKLGQTLHDAASSAFPSLVDGPPEQLMTQAVKPGKNNINWNADVKTAIPLMKSAEQTLGHPIANIQDALDAAAAAKKGIWQQYQARLGPAAAQSATIDGNQIADAMVNSLDARTAAQNPGLVAQIKQVADTYRRPLNLGEAEDYLQSTNRDLNTYYAKNKVGQQVAQADPQMAATVAEGHALRDGLYGKLDEVSGPGAAQLKKAYGSLTNVEKEMYGRQLVAARQNPESLGQQLSTAAGYGKIAKGVLTMSPGDVIEGTQRTAVANALKARNTSDAMIQRAFSAAQPATPFPQPSFRAPASAARQLPAQSGAPTILPYNPQMTPGEQVAATMQDLRRGPQLSLPANAGRGAPTVLPQAEQMSGGEQVAALMHYLRMHPQLQLPSKAAAIPLPPGTE